VEEGDDNPREGGEFQLSLHSIAGFTSRRSLKLWGTLAGKNSANRLWSNTILLHNNWNQSWLHMI